MYSHIIDFNRTSCTASLHCFLVECVPIVFSVVYNCLGSRLGGLHDPFSVGKLSGCI